MYKIIISVFILVIVIFCVAYIVLTASKSQIINASIKKTAAFVVVPNEDLEQLSKYKITKFSSHYSIYIFMYSPIVTKRGTKMIWLKQ